MPIYSLTGFFVCIDFFRVNYYEKEGIKNNLSTSLWRRFPLFKCVFKLGLFGRMQGAFLFVGRGACSRRRSFRTAEDESPYSDKTSVYFLSYQKSVAGATRQAISHSKKRCGAWDTAASVPTTFLLLFSSPEKRRYPTQSTDGCPYIKKSIARLSKLFQIQKFFAYFFTKKYGNTKKRTLSKVLLFLLIVQRIVTYNLGRRTTSARYFHCLSASFRFLC